MNTYPLARALRPTHFGQLVGHKHVVDSLKKLLHPLKHHTFLLTGQRGLGKTTLARLISKSLLCPHQLEGNPCGACDICESIHHSQHPDVIEIDGASRTKVEEMREMIVSCATVPLCSPYKVYIIDEVHMLSGHSFNALLKTLEEPPQHVIFVLATTELAKIPATIRSRCLNFTLNQPAEVDLLAYLHQYCDAQGIESNLSVLEAIVQESQGSYRDLLNILEYLLAVTDKKLNDPSLLSLFSILGNEERVACTDALLEGRAQDLVKILDTIFKKGASPEKLLRYLMNFCFENKNISLGMMTSLYQDLSKMYLVLSQHPDPMVFVTMGLLRFSTLVALKKKVRSEGPAN